MDPNANLAELRRLIALFIQETDAAPDDDTKRHNDNDVDRASELFEALDNWLTYGGFLPQPWQNGQNARLDCTK